MKITENKLRNIIRRVIAENIGDLDITADPGLPEFQDTHDPRHKDFDHASSAEEHPFLDIFSQMCSSWMLSDAMTRKQIENAAQSLLDESEKDVVTFRRCLENTCAPESLDAILPRDFY